MAKLSFWNIRHAQAAITAADEAIEPALSKANITTIKVEGRDVPASEAPLADRIRAVLAVSSPQTSSQDMSELVATNDTLARRIEVLETENAQLKAGNAALTTENVQLKGELATALTSVESLTASNAELNVRHEAALRQVADGVSAANQVNTRVSEMCVAACCIELPVPATATREQKIAAAKDVPVLDKLKAYEGAVNSAVARIGANAPAVPNGAPTGASLELGHRSTLERYHAISDPKEKVAHYRKHKDAIDAAYRAARPQN